LEEILNRKVSGRSTAYLEYEIKPKIPLFVQTESFFKAQNILGSNRLLILTGEPGIGKTTLSEFLCLSFTASDYSFFYCEDVGEVEELFIKG
jgi:Cdc6-like AAA superfamily ATPase